MSTGQGRGILQRREFLILLPAALLVLVLLSSYTLLSYHGAIEILLEDRQREAAQLARQLSVELASAPMLPDADGLRRRLPHAQGVTVFDAAGRLLIGDSTSENPGVAGWPLSAVAGEGLAAGTARFKRGGETFTLRVELAAGRLRSRQRSLGILAPVLLTVNVAITVLVAVFLRRFLAPFDRLVEQARDAGQPVSESQDEVVFLIETFEKALEALARPTAAPDVDELKALEVTLARSLESGVLLLDSKGQVLALNEVGVALLALESTPVGRPLAEAIGRHESLRRLLEAAIRRRRPVQRQECAITTTEGDRVLGVTVHPLRRDDAEVRGYLVMFADLTETQRETRERQLVDSLSQLGELTAGVAHELRNSLATLRGYLALIERSPDQEPIGDYLGEIRRESDHLQRVLEDFLMFARPGSARPQEVDLLGLMHRAAADPALGEAAVAVEVEPVEAESGTAQDATTAFEVLGDPQLLERALRNVLSNAAYAQCEAGEDGPVRARVARRAEGVEIVIEDQGAGLSEEAREKLFDPFFTGRADGVGMGLALTRRIVLLHAGRITLENRQQGGTRATFWLPRRPSEVARARGRMDTEGNNRALKEAVDRPRPGDANP